MSPQDDETIPDLEPSAPGIIDCLRMLAAEAAELNLSHTLASIFQAIDTCAMEVAREIDPRLN